MRGTPLRILLALAAVLALGGCGIGDEEPTVPEPNAEALLSTLDDVEENVNGQSCALAAQDANDFLDGVNALPAEVDDELKQGLREGAERLVELADSQCVENGATGDGGVVETEQPTIPETTSDTTTETDTTPEETTDPPASDQPPEEELVPPNGDESDDGGEDGSSGSGGGESGTLNDTGGIGGGGGG